MESSQVPDETKIKSKSQSAVMPTNTMTDLKSLLEELGLKQYFREKLPLSKILEINMKTISDEPAKCKSDLPWYFLKKLMMFNVTSINLKCTSDCESNSDDDSGNEDLDFDNIIHSLKKEEMVNPLDIITALFLCSDGFLQQEIALKMSVCQFSVPLLLPSCGKEQCTLMLWAMRDIVKKYRPHSLSQSKGFIEERIVLSELPMVSFVRLGDCSLSKSEILNKLLSNSQQYHNTFVHHNMECGDSPRRICNGLTEITWYLPCGNINIDIFSQPVAVANLRGDIASFETQYSFLCQTSAAVFVFFDCLDSKSVISLLRSQHHKAKIFLVGNFESKSFSLDALEKVATELGLAKNNIILKTKQKNDADFINDLRKKVRNVVEKSEMKMKIEEMVDAAHELGILVDEDSPECQTAKKNAEAITSEIEDAIEYKEHQLPRQGQILKDLACLEKEEFRLRNVGSKNTEDYKSDLQKHKEKLRKKQNSHKMLTGMTNFITGISRPATERMYFLKWMQMNLDKVTHLKLSELRDKYKEKCKNSESKEEIKEIDRLISSCSLGTEHFFREMGQIYEASVSLPERDPYRQQFQHLPKLCAELLLDGFPLELVDGDSSNIPLRWVSAVLSQLNDLVSPKKDLESPKKDLASSGNNSGSSNSNSSFPNHNSVAPDNGLVSLDINSVSNKDSVPPDNNSISHHINSVSNNDSAPLENNTVHSDNRSAPLDNDSASPDNNSTSHQIKSGSKKDSVSPDNNLDNMNSVSNNDSPPENESGPLDNDPAPPENNSAHPDNDFTSPDNNSAPSDNDLVSPHIDSMSNNDSEPQENDSAHPDNDSAPPDNNSEPPDNDSVSLHMNSVSNNDSVTPENGSMPLDNHSATHHVNSMSNNDSAPQENNSVPPDNDSVPLDIKSGSNNNSEPPDNNSVSLTIASVSKNNSAPPESDSAPPDNDSAPPNNNSAPPDNDLVSPLINSMSNNDSELQENDSAHPDNDSAPPDNNSEPPDNDSISRRMNSVSNNDSPPENESGPLDNDSAPPDTKSVSLHMNSVSNNDSVTPENSSMPPDNHSATHHVNSMSNNDSAPQENNSEPPDNNSVSLTIASVSKNNSVPPESNSAPPDNDSAPPNNNSAPPDNDLVSPLINSMSNNDSEPQENDSAHPDNDSAPPDNNSEPPDNDSISHHMNSVLNNDSPPENESGPLDNDSAPPDTKSVSLHMNSVSNNDSVTPQNGSMPPDNHSATHHVNSMSNNDSAPQENNSVPPDNDSVPLDIKSGSNNNSEPPDNNSVSLTIASVSKNNSAPPESDSAPPDNDSAPPNNNSAPPDNDLVSPLINSMSNNDSEPQENDSAHPDNDSAPPDNNSEPPDNDSISRHMNSVSNNDSPPENESAPQENNSVPPDNNSVSLAINSVSSNRKILVVTVLGVQSTGKSTLLNTMFGVQFAVSSGRCTRGAFMLLIKINEDMKNVLNCDFMVIIDTEGLKSPQLAQLDNSYEHDNELATLVVGLSDVTIVNIAMENLTEMKDILQIVVHAFLRMKEVGKKPKCHFVHQNVSDVSACENNLRERKLLLHQLNEITQTAAKMENKDKNKSFTDVMDYSPDTGNSYIPGLWNGNPPMAPVNTGYSEAVYELKKNIIQLLTNCESSANDIMEFKEWVKSLWNAVKHENFIFSFRNSLVADAYMKLCTEFNKWEWEFRKEMYTWVRDAETKISNFGTIAAKYEIADMREYLRSLKSEASTVLSTWETKILDNLREYFEQTEGHVYLVEGYKDEFSNSAKIFHLEIKSSVIYQLEAAAKIRKGMTEIDKIKESHRKEIEKAVCALIDKCRKKNVQMSDAELNNEFTIMWSETLEKLSFTEQKPKNVTDSVAYYLRDNLNHRGSHARELLKEKSLRDCGNESFKYSVEGWFCKFKHTANKVFTGQDHIITAQHLADRIIDGCTDFVNEQVRRKSNYYDIYIQEILHMIDKKLQNNQDVKINIKFEVSLKQHICGFSAREFQKMHEDFVKENDPYRCLMKNKERFREDFKDVFHKRDQCQKKAEEFTNRCLKPAVEDFVNRSLGPDIIDEIRKLEHFITRMFLQYSILLDLLSKEDFQEYVSYICSYEKYVKTWILNQIKKHFSNQSSVFEFEDRHLRSCIDSINSAMNKVQHRESDDLKAFVENICKELAEKLLISQDALGAFMILNNADKEQFTDCLTTSVNDMTEALRNKFKESTFEMKLEHLHLQPQNELFKQLIGCGKQCPFCAAPCDAGGKAHTEHFASLHRPEGLGGYRWERTDKLDTDICSSLVISDDNFRCSVTNNEWHPYKKYKEIFKEWKIQPDVSLEASDYWKYVMRKYNMEFAKEYKAGPAVIPAVWNNINKDQAEKSLKESFNV